MKLKQASRTTKQEKDLQKNRATNLAKVLYHYNYLHNKEAVPSSIKIICPFHEDINPSMLVDIKDGSWFCFGCNEHGDAYKFVNLIEKRLNGLNDLQSIIYYNKLLNNKSNSDITIKPSRKTRGAFDYELYDLAYDYYYGLRKVPWMTSGELIDEELEVLEYMKERGFNGKALQKANAKITYNPGYPIIFPMLDNGKFKGWVCRTTNPAIEKKRKYLYNEGFSRATTLVGNYGSEDYVILVEGYMDRLKVLQYGEGNVVAILGWKISHEQIDKLKAKGIKLVISALDNDTAGKKGTQYLKEHFEMLRFSYPKGIKDPADMSEEQFDKAYYRTMERYDKYLRHKKTTLEKERKM